MQKCKKGAALLLAASMMTFLLAGCGSNQVTTENTGSSDYRPDRGDHHLFLRFCTVL